MELVKCTATKKFALGADVIEPGDVVEIKKTSVERLVSQGVVTVGAVETQQAKKGSPDLAGLNDPYKDCDMPQLRAMAAELGIEQMPRGRRALIAKIEEAKGGAKPGHREIEQPAVEPEGEVEPNIVNLADTAPEPEPVATVEEEEHSGGADDEEAASQGIDQFE